MTSLRFRFDFGLTSLATQFQVVSFATDSLLHPFEVFVVALFGLLAIYFCLVVVSPESARTRTHDMRRFANGSCVQAAEVLVHIHICVQVRGRASQLPQTRKQMTTIFVAVWIKLVYMSSIRRQIPTHNSKEPLRESNTRSDCHKMMAHI